MYVFKDKMVISNEAFQEPVQLATPEPCLIFLRQSQCIISQGCLACGTHHAEIVASGRVPWRSR